MKKYLLQDIDKIREMGFRPQVVGCFVNDRKILFVYKEKHRLWQLPQGGIDNRETVEDAFFREMNEELGEFFVGGVNRDLEILGEAQVEFPKKAKGTRSLKTDRGEDIFMKGKKYFFVKALVSEKEIDLTDTEFNDYRWVDYSNGIKLSEEIYQQGKKRITLKALDLLRQNKLI